MVRFFIYLSFRPKTNLPFLFRGTWSSFLRSPPKTLVNSRKQNSPYTWRRRVCRRFIFYSVRFLRRKTHYDNSVRMCACLRLAWVTGVRVKQEGGSLYIRLGLKRRDDGRRRREAVSLRNSINHRGLPPPRASLKISRRRSLAITRILAVFPERI